MANTRYQVGDRVVVQTTFTVENGTPTSPSTVVGEYRAPGGTTTPLTPAEASAGVWRMTLPTFTVRGLWHWYIAGTAGVIAADQGSILVDDKVTT
jgi:hypothetical protein